MSGKMVPCGNGQYVVVVRGYGFVTRSALLKKDKALALLARLTFKGKVVPGDRLCDERRGV
jgi:hypothetical protein